MAAAFLTGGSEESQSRHDVAEIGAELAVAVGGWPAAVHDIQSSVGLENGRYKRRPTTSTALYFPKEAARPLEVSFVDGMGLVHYIQVDSTPVRILVPLDPHVVKHLVNFHKVIEWRCQAAIKPVERSFIDPRSSMVECCFSYQPAAFVHTHAILVEITPHGLKAPDSALRRDMAQFEQDFWNARLEEVRACNRMLDVDSPPSTLAVQPVLEEDFPEKKAPAQDRLEQWKLRWELASPALSVGNPCAFLYFLPGCCSRSEPVSATQADTLEYGEEKTDTCPDTPPFTKEAVKEVVKETSKQSAKSREELTGTCLDAPLFTKEAPESEPTPIQVKDEKGETTSSCMKEEKGETTPVCAKEEKGETAAPCMAEEKGAAPCTAEEKDEAQVYSL